MAPIRFFFKMILSIVKRINNIVWRRRLAMVRIFLAAVAEAEGVGVVAALAVERQGREHGVRDVIHI